MARVTPKNMAFLKLYLGRSTEYHGNATRCYAKVYECKNERIAQAAGSRLTHVPEIRAKIDAYQHRASEQIQVDATFVLEQSVRIYDRAMGDASVEVDHIGACGELVTSEIREHMPAIAVKALELIGKHTQVQAFQENVEHTHTHRLERALQARQKEVERKACTDPSIIEGQSSEIVNTPPQIEAGEGLEEEEKKGGSSPEVIHLGESSDEKTSCERAGAAGE